MHFSPEDVSILAIIAEHPIVSREIGDELLDLIMDPKAERIAKLLLGRRNVRATVGESDAAQTLRQWAKTQKERAAARRKRIGFPQRP